MKFSNLKNVIIILLILIIYGGKLFGKEIENKNVKKEFNIVYCVTSCFNIGKITMYNDRYEFKKRRFDYNIDKNLISGYITVKEFFQILEKRIKELFDNIVIKNNTINIRLKYKYIYEIYAPYDFPILQSENNTYLINFYSKNFNSDFINILHNSFLFAITPDFADKINSTNDFYIGTEKEIEQYFITEENVDAMEKYIDIYE